MYVHRWKINCKSMRCSLDFINIWPSTWKQRDHTYYFFLFIKWYTCHVTCYIYIYILDAHTLFEAFVLTPLSASAFTSKSIKSQKRWPCLTSRQFGSFLPWKEPNRRTLMARYHFNWRKQLVDDFLCAETKGIIILTQCPVVSLPCSSSNGRSVRQAN